MGRSDRPQVDHRLHSERRQGPDSGPCSPDEEGKGREGRGLREDDTGSEQQQEPAAAAAAPVVTGGESEETQLSADLS